MFWTWSMHLFIYNPYSIVNERSIVPTDAERSAPGRGDCAHRRSDGEANFCGDSEGRNQTLPASLVELIGIEPTTPCLQSRCSPN